jgi:hypothetical protein
VLRKLRHIEVTSDEEIAQLKRKVQEMTIRTNKLNTLQEQMDQLNKKLGIE